LRQRGQSGQRTAIGDLKSEVEQICGQRLTQKQLRQVLAVAGATPVATPAANSTSETDAVAPRLGILHVTRLPQVLVAKSSFSRHFDK
jgi:hypothetical protein